MATTTLTFDINENAVEWLLRSEGGPVGQHVRKKGRLVYFRARQLAPVDTGALRDSIQLVTGKTNDGEMMARIRVTAKHARYVMEGTGVYAGRGLIFPKKGPRLVWTDKYGDRHAAPFIYGQVAQPFLPQSLDAIRG